MRSYMSRMLAILLALTLTACASGKPNQVLSIPTGTLVLTEDYTLIRSACAHIPASQIVAGCYDPRTKTIFCARTNLSACGHELLHLAGLRHEEF